MAEERKEQIVGAIRPTLFVGLGGTGKEVLLRLRRRFYERFGTPGLPCIDYLWLDTDTRDVMAQGEKVDKIYQAVRFEDREKLALLDGKVGTDLANVFSNRGQWQHVHRWLYPEVDRFGREISDGAGGVRAVGRLTFYYQYDRIRPRIDQILGSGGLATQEVIERTQAVFKRLNLPQGEFATPPQVFLIFSIAGGTGCGTFLDVAFFLRALSHTRSIERIAGIVLLPNVYFPVCAGEVAQRAYGNAYAALKELEFYTLRRKEQTAEHREQVPSGERDLGLSVDFDAEWQRGYSQSVQGPPFTLTYFLEMQNEAEIGLQTRSELFHMIAESLFLDVMPGQFATAKRSQYANVTQYLSSPELRNIALGGVELPQSFARRYASFGLSKIEIPMERIKAACAAELAREILTYWNREPQDRDIRRNTLEDIAGLRIDAEGILARFGDDWRTTIRDELGRRFGRLALSSDREVQGLEEGLRVFERETVNDEGEDPARWGTVISNLSLASERIGKQVCEALQGWLRDCLEKAPRGLKAVLRPDGYLRLALNELEGLYTPLEQGGRAIFDQQIDRVEQQMKRADAARQRALRQLRWAVRSMLRQGIDLSGFTIGYFKDFILRQEQRYAEARVERFRLLRAKQIAEVAFKFLQERQRLLERFAEIIEPMAAEFRDEKAAFLNFTKGVLFIRFFDPNEDWKKFYLLDLENAKMLRPINAEIAQRRFLGSLTKAQPAFYPPGFSGEPSLWEVVQGFQRAGQTGLQDRLRAFTEERFREDFQTHPREMEVLEHPQMHQQWADTIKRLVRSASPMARRDSVIGGARVAAQSIVYVGMAQTPDSAERYGLFWDQVRSELEGAGYSRDSINFFVTDRPSEAYVYIVSYAFPLPSLPLVAADCHKAYYDFYQGLRSGNASAERNRIPLHLSSEWEGKFDDLTVYGDREAKEIKETLEVLLFGSLLRVLDIISDESGALEYGYRRWVPPAAQRQIFGRRREAIEVLRNDARLRSTLSREALARETQLDKQTLLDYHWCLSHLSRNGNYVAGSPEKTLIDSKLNELEPRLLQAGWSQEETSLEAVVNARGLTEIEKDRRISAEASARVGDRAAWIGSFPVLATLQPWVRKDR